jgi:hypothetical protein
MAADWNKFSHGLYRISNPQPASGEIVLPSPGYFSTFRMSPFAGYSQRRCRRLVEPVAMILDCFSQQEYALDPPVLGALFQKRA